MPKVITLGKRRSLLSQRLVVLQEVAKCPLDPDTKTVEVIPESEIDVVSL